MKCTADCCTVHTGSDLLHASIPLKEKKEKKKKKRKTSQSKNQE